MSLDGTALLVWQMERPPLTMLVAAKTCEMFGDQLSAEIRAPFISLSKALLDWWPSRQPDAKQIYEAEFQACLDVFGEREPDAELPPMLRYAYLQLAAVLKVAPWSLPTDAYCGLTEKDFQGSLRDAAKAGRLPVAQLEARLKHLLEYAKEPWPKLIARANRMSWTRGPAWSKLDKRLRELASLADLGANSSWIDLSGQRALQLELEGIKRIAMLSPEEITSLRRVIPTVALP